MKVYHTEFAIGNKLLDDYLNKSIQDVEDLHVQYEKLEEIKDIIKKSKLVYLCGNGGSSATASHFANDLKKMCNINAICLSDNTPLLTAIANDISYIKVFQQQISKELIDIIGKDKVTLVVFSGSGNSQNIFDVVGYGQSLGINVIAFLGMKGGVIKNIQGIHKIHIETDMLHAEDIHLIICHTISKLISDELD